jgi:HNH endonuclease
MTDVPKFEPADKCIYCGSDGGGFPLSDEHIIPYSLGGTFVYPRASCRECAKKTCSIEGYIGRQLFQEFRLSNKLQSRRKKEQPSVLPVYLNYKDRTDRIEMAINKHPATIAMVQYPMPTILNGGPPSDHWAWTKLLSWTVRSNIPQDIPGVKSIKLKLQVNHAHYAAFLAKIGHGFATAHHGVSGFRPFLPDLILGRTIFGAHLIGSEWLLPPPGDHDFVYSVGIWTFREKRYVVVRLHLFAGIGKAVPGSPGPPVYWIVAGEIELPSTTPSLCKRFLIKRR